MDNQASATSLLRAAEVFYDAPGNPLAQAARRAWVGGFASGGEWMRQALGVIRREIPASQCVRFSRLGCIKYGLACSAALLPVILAIQQGSAWLLLAAVPLFYLVEAQMVFLFPLALDGSPRAMAESLDWTRRAGGTLRVMRVVMVIAISMMFGGLLRRGFVRSWCLGCLAILVWYEALRKAGGEPSAKKLYRFEIGSTHPLQVRRTHFRIFENERALRLVYASDLHFNARKSCASSRQLVDAVREACPDLIVLGGDLADTRGGLATLAQTVKALSDCAPVWAIPGNHDHQVGLSEVQGAVLSGGGHWLGEQSVCLRKLEHTLHLDGAIPENISSGRGRILCVHDPKIFPQAVAFGYPLVLAGHLHGGQVVLAESRGRLFPAAWFYRWNGTQFQSGQSTLLVSRGVSDTLPVRWNCPREILLCELY